MKNSFAQELLWLENILAYIEKYGTMEDTYILVHLERTAIENNGRTASINFNFFYETFYS